MHFSFSRTSSCLGDARSSTDYVASARGMATAVWHIDGRIGILARLDATRKTGPSASARPDRHAHSIHIVVAVALGPKYARFKVFSCALCRNKLCSARMHIWTHI